MLNAKITFGNVFAQDSPVDGVSMSCFPDKSTINPGKEDFISPSSSSSNNHRNGKCTVDEKCFEPPEDYQILGKLEKFLNWFKQRNQKY